jgi:M6 family metalloprotease-like protein
VGEQKVIVIKVNFPDVKPILTKEQIYNKVFVDLDNYFRDASYGKMWLAGNVTGPYVLPHPIADYNTTIQNITADKTRMLSLVQDTMDAADGDVNFSQYSHVMIVLGASFRQYTAMCFSALPGMLSLSGTAYKIFTKSGQTISSAAVFSEDCYLGNFAHDTMHMLGGVIDGNRVTPCLYDQDLQGSSLNTLAKIHIGNWDPLSCHVYKTALPPSGLVSWTKLRLGWIEPSKIAMVSPGQTTTVTLDPLDSSASSTLVIKIPLTSDTFYLVENRQKVGFDQYAPSTGVLISYADDGYKGECRHGQGPVQLMDANPGVPNLEGAAFDIGKKEIFKDTQNNLAIILQRKVDLSYEIKITTADKADIASGSCVFPTFPEGFQRTK